MKFLKINFNNVSDDEIEEIAEAVKAGKVIVSPTDTIYGIGCLATDKKAVNKVFKIKKRSKEKALLVLVKSWCMVKKYFFISGKKEKYLRTIWPGPITVLLKQRGLIPDDVAPGKEKIAVRLPNNEFLIKLIKKIDEPIVSTSLNLTGDNNILDVSDLEKYFKKEKPDLVVDIGKKLKGKPSRLIDIEDLNNIKIIRK